MRSFEISVPDDVLNDLSDRLAGSRLLGDSPRRPATGLSAAYLAELVDAWRSFDWRARERWLNQDPQYLADVRGTRLHFVHRRARNADAPAVLLEVGTRTPGGDGCDYPDIDMVLPKGADRYFHRDGTPYPKYSRRS